MNTTKLKTITTFSKEEYEAHKFDSPFVFILVRSLFLMFIWFTAIASFTLGYQLLIPAVLMWIGYFRWMITRTEKFAVKNREFLDMIGKALLPELGYKMADRPLLLLCSRKQLVTEDYYIIITPSEDAEKMELRMIRNVDRKK